MNERVIELSSRYLCGDDISTEEMVELIYNHENQDELIDYVDGVVVWEKVEYEFTCKEFLEEVGYVK